MTSPFRPTLEDVARRAGVSRVTASRVLNNATNYPISERTRRRVLQAAAELQYEASIPAKALRGKRTLQYGLTLRYLAFSFMPNVIEGLQHAANTMDYGCLLYVTYDDPELEERLIDKLFNRRVDGMIWMPAHTQTEKTQSIVKHIPTVELLYRSSVPGLPALLIDQEMGGYLAAEHLVSLGHRRIAYIRRIGVHWSERIKGYERALREAGITPDPDLVKVASDSWDELTVVYNELMALDDPPTAIIGPSDLGAWGLIEIAARSGRRVPQDLSIVGFGNTGIADRTPLRLCTIDHPKRNIGEQAMQMLAALIDGRDVEDVILQPTLIPGDTACPPSRA